MIRIITTKLKHILAITFAIAFLVVIWEVYIPASLTPKTAVIYTIKSGASSSQVARELKSLGIIKNAAVFTWYVIISGQEQELQAGSYELSPSISVASMVKKMAKGEGIYTAITIPEGWSIQDIGALLASGKTYAAGEFTAAIAKDWKSQFSFLQDKPAGASLEGYLFPDTYYISPGQAADQLVSAMLSNLQTRLTPELQTEITRQQKSVFEIVTMASIIEKEVRSLEDKKTVSGILWKRLENDMPLQTDSTVNYITGKHSSRASTKDIAIQSPYNTYQHTGLPKGPICNPGIESILAAIYPTQSNYWYYLSADGTGQTIFSKTLDEHNLAIKKYLTNK